MGAQKSLPGTFRHRKQNGMLSFRASITYQGRHISLGSFEKEQEAHEAYCMASFLLFEKREGCIKKMGTALLSEKPSIEAYENYDSSLSFEKWVMLLNLKKSGIYCKNPIYLKEKYFLYYVDRQTALKFDAEDLFYYQKHKIWRRGDQYYVSDYGLQVSILSRYGIKSYGAAGRDYRFANGDPLDYRYQNIVVINRYYGVTKERKKGRDVYAARIHINGNVLIGRYDTEMEAAIAYNKAVDFAQKKGMKKNFLKNYIEELDVDEYEKYYLKIRIK